jgi:hypothetical protein
MLRLYLSFEGLRTHDAYGSATGINTSYEQAIRLQHTVWLGMGYVRLENEVWDEEALAEP